MPCESVDGRTLYYKRSWDPGALIALPAAGGKETTILPCAMHHGYAAAPRGLYHWACTPGAALGRESRLLLWDAATGRDQVVAVLGFGGSQGLSISPDGRAVIYGGTRLASDLMMIENFR